MAKIIKFPGPLTAKQVLKNVLRDHGKELEDVMVCGWDKDGQLILYSNTINYAALSAASLIWGDQAVKALNGALIPDGEEI